MITDENLKLIKILRTDLHLTHPRFDDIFIYRFLKKEKYDLYKCKNSIKKYINWRDEFNVDDIIKNFKVGDLHKLKSIYPQGYHGVDKLGHPIYIERLGLLKADEIFNFISEDDLVKYWVLEYEKLVDIRMRACSIASKKNITKTCAILDLEGIGNNCSGCKTD
eukprot:GHVL01044628.1.p1 GENE.GHVL01044628.1~~GHVL01044628.1.p1  ORF type:complete len:164 (-),score=29.91 GHVL01044628.1:197-688(-)